MEDPMGSTTARAPDGRRSRFEIVHDPVSDTSAPRLRILASGSSGNCSILVDGRGPHRRAWLIDAGLSPRRTRLLLAASGLGPADLRAVLLTHLDSDHFHPGWLRAPDLAAPFLIHQRHHAAARRAGVPRLQAFDGPFILGDHPAAPSVHPMLLAHDDLGTTAYRFQFASGASLGFATDLGRATDAFIDHMAGVGALALESNYCPRMQVASGRPWHLQRRIMDGSGHLSNEQAAEAAAAIRPLHLILLHLSRECNTPERAARHHAGADYRLTIAQQFRSTPWVEAPARPGPRARLAVRSVRAGAAHTQPCLFRSAT